MKLGTVFGLIIFATLVGCEAPKPQSSEPAAPAEESESMPGEGAATSPGGKAPASDPAQPAAAPLPPLSPFELKKLLTQAYNLLDAGEEDKARAELERASQSNPKEEEVRCLLNGVTTADPQAAYGKDARTHTVARGENLGIIARNYTGKVCEFYAIARYNNIRVPKQLAVGQAIRIPATLVVNTPPPSTPQPHPAPAPSAKPAPAPAPAAPPAPPPVAVPAAPAAPNPAEVDRLYRKGIAAYQRHDLKGAIGIFNQVLALNPSHGGAGTYRQRALDECAKINKISPGSCAM